VAARGRRRARGVPHPVSAALDEVADTVTEGSPEVYAEIQRAFDGADDVAAAAREIADSDSEAFAALYETPAATARDGSDTSDATATDDATTATDDTTTATDDAATETRTNMIDREAVRNNANYLRNVRPIDPEEIAEYIEGSPHPAVVRETLREEAFDLRLREREDGAFEPVSEEPVPAPGWAPTAPPENYSFALEDLLVREFGANWHREESGDKLREAVRRLKDDYLYGNDVAYDRVAALGYAIYHLPAYYATIGYVLDDLTENGLLDRTLRVLDVGAGVGGPALGLHDYLPDDAVVDYHAVEPSAAADVLDRMLDETGRNFRPTIHEETAESFFGIDGGAKAVTTTPTSSIWSCSGTSSSELDDPVAVVEAALGRLADDGSVVAFAPRRPQHRHGTPRGGARGRDPETGVETYSPTLRLWPDATPLGRWVVIRRGRRPRYPAVPAPARRDRRARLD